MKRLITLLAALIVLGGGGPQVSVAVAAQAQCCRLYCEIYRDMCEASDAEEKYCDAWYQGCIDGCAHRPPGGPM